MRLVKRVSMILIASSAFGLAACGGGGDDDDGDGPDEVDPNGTHNGFVLDSVLVPGTTAAANSVALDIDDDGRTENALGGLLATLAGFGLNVQPAVNEQIAMGGVIILADVQATALDNATGVGVRVFRGGSPDPMPCADEADTVCGAHLDGSASFSIAEDYDALVVGQIVNGSFTGGPGEVTIELAVSEQTAVPINLIGARIEMGVSATGLTSGKLGGAITVEDIDSDLLPGVVSLVGDIVAECEPTAEECCPEGSGGEQALTILNTDGNDATGDCEVTLADLMENDIVDGTLRNPDLDLLDESGNFAPNSDGTKESVSLGVGFSAVAGTFTAP